jgi:hypothetical protein
MPGKLSVPMLYRHQCPGEILTLEPRDLLCIINPISEDFDRVMLVIREGIIRQLQFIPADLPVFALVHRWGRPARIRRSTEGYHLSWGVGVIAHAPEGGQFSYMLSVSSVLPRSGTDERQLHQR